ncbi:putative kinase [Rhizobium pisi]
MPTLYLTCGLPGSGKTSLAISTPEAETGPCRGRVENLQWQIAMRAIKLQCNVVIDWGVWSRAKRDACRDEARAVGARVVLCFLDVPFDELWDRVSRRNAELPVGTFDISWADLLRWSKLFEPPTAEELALYDQQTHPAITGLT